MATHYWCLNFDNDDNVLEYGLQKRMWLMQYEYAHEGHDYENNNENKAGELVASTARLVMNWNAASSISPGDWCAAYLPGNRFYAIAKVVRPRKPSTYQDTLARMQAERRHIRFKGVTTFTDAAGALYADYTDRWYRPVNNPRCSTCRENRDSKELWKYAQRIDVEKWEHIVKPDGVVVPGLAQHALHGYRTAAFEVDKEFFTVIRTKLQQAARG